MEHQAFAQILGSYGEFVGAIGVVLTLIYLARQIRQNTRQLERAELAAKAAAVNASNLALREPRRTLIESSELTEIFILGNENPEQLGDIAQMRYRLLMQNVVDTMVVIHSETLVTGFAPDTWASQGTTLVQRVLGTTGGRWFWVNFAASYPGAFRADVDRVLQRRAQA